MTTLQTEVRRSPAVVTATGEAATTSHCSRSFLDTTQSFELKHWEASRQTGRAGHPVVERIKKHRAEATYPTDIFSSALFPIKWNVAGQETRVGGEGTYQ